ncbi:MAG: sugar phosphate isomerase/epimerase [Armatimonadetes bacterium]|nr:sugar phosphate isomerase/epimerase [Armatimonadota bacterium]MDW8027286.1 TIM barrel protein [Armatimonadota bacterium]
MTKPSFKLGVVQFMAFPNTDQNPEALVASLKSLAIDSDFSLVELTKMPNQQTLNRVRSILDAAYMDCSFAATPVILRQNLNPSATNETARKNAVSLLKSCVDEAIALGAKALTLMSGPFGGDEVNELKSFVKTLDEICSYAADNSPDEPILVLVEPFDRNIDKKALVGPSYLAGALASEMLSRHKNFGLLIDLSHLPLLNEAIDDCLISLPPDSVRHVHIGNCVISPDDPLYGDQHPPFGYPGSQNDVEQVRVFLSALHYSGYFSRPSLYRLPTVSFEVKPLPEQDPLIVLANAKRVLKEAIS